MGSDLCGETKADHIKGMAWWFTTEGTLEEIEAWYDEQLAEYEKEAGEDGYIHYTLYPDDGEAGEYMGVIVEEDGRFRVFERVKPENSNS